DPARRSISGRCGMPRVRFPSLGRALIEGLENRQLQSVTPTIAASTSQLVFGDPVGGGWAAAQTITLRNTSTAPLIIPAGGMALTGPAAAQFHSGAPVNKTTIAAGGSLTFGIAFGATQLGPQGATLAIASNAGNAPNLSIALRGLGTRGLQGSNEPSLQ